MFWFSGTFLKTPENIWVLKNYFKRTKFINRNAIFNRVQREKWKVFYKIERYVGVLVIKKIGPLVWLQTHGLHSDTHLRPMLRLDGMCIAACLCWSGVCPLWWRCHRVSFFSFFSRFRGPVFCRTRCTLWGLHGTVGWLWTMGEHREYRRKHGNLFELYSKSKNLHIFVLYNTALWLHFSRKNCFLELS